MSFAYLIRYYSGLAKTTLSHHYKDTIDFGEWVEEGGQMRKNLVFWDGRDPAYVLSNKPFCLFGSTDFVINRSFKLRQTFFSVQKNHPTVNLTEACELTPVTLSLSYNDITFHSHPET